MRWGTFHSFSPEGGIGDEILEKIPACSRACFRMSDEVMGGGFVLLMDLVDSKFPLVQTCLVDAVHVPSALGGGDETLVAVVIHVSCSRLLLLGRSVPTDRAMDCVVGGF